MAADKSNISKEELQKRLKMHESAQALEGMKRDMKRPRSGGIPDVDASAMPIQDLSTAGQSDEQVYTNLKEELGSFLEKLAEYAFSPEQYNRYFPDNKIVTLIKIMKSAGMELESRYVLDIFKDRVKQKNGGKIPTIKEKKGFLGKAVERQMKPEEIAYKFEIEDHAPQKGDEPASLGKVGDKNGIMKHLVETLLQNEEIEDPFKRGPRKTLGKFLQVAKLVDVNTTDANEKFFVATLLTPDSAQPKGASDKEGVQKLLKVVQKGNKWLEAKLASAKQEAPAEEKAAK